jgi:hypothetical protein
MEINFAMNHAFNRCQKRIPRRQITVGREDFEELLLEGLNSGASKPMTTARKKRIYLQALGGDLLVALR